MECVPRLPRGVGFHNTGPPLIADQHGVLMSPATSRPVSAVHWQRIHQRDGQRMQLQRHQLFDAFSLPPTASMSAGAAVPLTSLAVAWMAARIGARRFAGVRRGRHRMHAIFLDEMSTDAPQGSQERPQWGLRRYGRKRGPGPKGGKAKKELPSIGRPITEDLGDAIDVGADQAMREGRSSEEGVHEVITEAAILARKGLRSPRGREIRQMQRDFERTLSREQRPQLLPHYRKAHDWNEDTEPPEFFFSKKPWETVHTIKDNIVSLAETLELPRPSRIQNLSFRDLAQGRHTVIADQAGSGKTLAYLLPLLQRHLLASNEKLTTHSLKLLIIAPTSDLAEQIMNVARVIASRSACGMRVHLCTGGRNVRSQKERLRAGTDVLIATPGRLAGLLANEGVVDLSSCGAVVMDEVDVLVRDGMHLSIDDLRQVLPYDVQWVFVTATLGETAREQLRAFEALPSTTNVAEKKKENKKQKAESGIAWHTGAGLHRVSPVCEHVLVDCTPKNLHEINSERRRGMVMREKTLALAWHLSQGVLNDIEDNRIVVFCNTIENCRFVENELRKLDTTDRRSGHRRWKVLVLHGLRNREDYEEVTKEFNSDRAKARDFFKKKLLVCTDRISRGMDFSRQPVQWVVLMDWPRDATEYLRRVGRTCRGGGKGGVLSLVAGITELKMAKQITSAALRGIPLQSGHNSKTKDELMKNVACLERFDPACEDWRAPEAAARKPLPRDPRDRARPDEDVEESQFGAFDRSLDFENAEEEEARNTAAAEQQWAPWVDKNWDGKKGIPWEEDAVAAGMYDDEDDDLDTLDINVGVSLHD